MESRPPRQPIFNMPGVLVAVLLLLLAIHAARTTLLSADQDWSLVAWAAFVPAIFDGGGRYIAEPLSWFWRPFTYALLHGDWVHVGVNVAYLAAFGTPVARRFGSARFLVFLLAGSLGGALAHFVASSTPDVPMVGASAAVSACMGAAVRFALQPGVVPAAAIQRPALTLAQSLRNRGIMTFVVIWFALNWIFGVGLIPMPGAENAGIAWEAHIGGFLVGWLAFAAFDPVRTADA